MKLAISVVKGDGRKSDIQKAVREIPIEKEGWGKFSNVVEELEQTLADAKSGKRGLPSLRSAAFDAADHQKLGRDSTYFRIINKATREALREGLRKRMETLHEEWIALQVRFGRHYKIRASRLGATKKDEFGRHYRRSAKHRAGATDKDELGNGQGNQLEATIRVKDRTWTRDELSRMFSSKTANMVWFNMILNRDERRRLVLWLDANFTREERTHFHPDLIKTANRVYGMHWAPPIMEKASVRRESARGKRERLYPPKPDWEEEEQYH